MRKGWTQDEIAYLIAHYSDSTPEVLEQHLQRSRSSIYQRATALGLKKSAHYFATAAAGRFGDGTHSTASRFQPGHQSWNRGLRGWCPAGSEKTWFKKGHQSQKTQPLGTYRITRDGLLQRKISNESGSNSKRWRSVHELVWIEANGPVPAKHIVVFKHGMKTTNPDLITADKVECITRAENARRNNERRDPELTRLYQLKGAITRQVNRITKESKEAT
jgi:hypothetical protein